MAGILGREPTPQEQAAAVGLSGEEYRDVMKEGLAARQRIVVSNLALVACVANKYKRSAASHQCGCLEVRKQILRQSMLNVKSTKSMG